MKISFKKKEWIYSIYRFAFPFFLFAQSKSKGLSIACFDLLGTGSLQGMFSLLIELYQKLIDKNINTISLFSQNERASKMFDHNFLIFFISAAIIGWESGKVIVFWGISVEMVENFE